MTNETNPPAEPEEIVIRPTVLYRMSLDTLEAVTVDQGDGRTLVVFRSEDAEKFRSATGKHLESEGFKAVVVDHEVLANILAWHGCSHVAMPEPWGEGGMVDCFEAEAFVGMLEESVRA
jgi:hypothetical protein